MRHHALRSSCALLAPRALHSPRALCAALLALWLLAPRSAPAEPRCSAAGLKTCQTPTEVWTVSTHDLPLCVDFSEGQPLDRMSSLRVERLTDCGWQPANLADLLASDACRSPTCLYLHGYNNGEADARECGLRVHRALSGESPSRGPLRLIVWMWPSEKTCEPLLDSFRSVAERVEPQAFYLAQFLAQLPCSGDLAIWGHSYGARLATAAVHLLGGGQLCGQGLSAGERLCGLRVLLTAAALDDNWLLPGERYGCALTTARRLTVLVSPTDPVLKRYGHVAQDPAAQALGSVGLNVACLPAESAAKVRQVNVSGLIGVAHVSQRYLRSFAVVDLIRGEILHEQSRLPARWTGNVVGRAAAQRSR